jgi:hypothetical protein
VQVHQSARRVARPVVIGIASALVVLMSAPAGAVETPRLGVKPAREANFFHLSLLPGAQTTNAAVVTNHSSETTRVRVYAVDAGITPQGQFALAGQHESRRTVGAWLVPNVNELVLGPHSTANVDFALAVPPGVAPGDYAGGIAIEAEPRAQPATAVDGETAVQLNVIERLGVRVYLKVEGDTREHLTAGRLHWTRQSGGAIEFSIALRNDGNVQLAPTGIVALKGLGISARPVKLVRPEVLLPSTSVTVRGQWASPPRYALGRANVVISYGDGHKSRASTAVRLVPVLPTAAGVFLALLLAYGIFRLTRFLRRARIALRVVNEHIRTNKGTLQ